MDVAGKMELFRELVRCGSDIYLWCYDVDGSLISSNCPEETLISSAFHILGCRERMISHLSCKSSPVLLGSSLGLVWGATFEQQDEKTLRAWVIGPVFYTETSVTFIREGFRNYIDKETDMVWRHRFIDYLYKVPVVPHVVFSRYLLMLHYCASGKHLDISDIDAGTIATAPQADSYDVSRDRHKVWSAEQALLQMVRNGDLDYKFALSNSSLLSSGVPVKSRDPLRQAKISCIVFCSIVCRAAIEGGLSPEEAYALGDAYIQSCESAQNMDTLLAIPLAMYDDFIHRVNKCRTNPKLSTPVQKCVDYIEMHLGERILAVDLAAVAGYGEYYITRKFREETGRSVNDYVKFAKTERAKVLLSSTEFSVQEISEALGFSTRSHFSQSFKQVTGMSPAEFRELKNKG